MRVCVSEDEHVKERKMGRVAKFVCRVHVRGGERWADKAEELHVTVTCDSNGEANTNEH